MMPDSPPTLPQASSGQKRLRSLTRTEHLLLTCFLALAFATFLLLWFQQRRSIASTPVDFYQRDDDCDGIPNFQDARFNRESAKQCPTATVSSR